VSYFNSSWGKKRRKKGNRGKGGDFFQLLLSFLADVERGREGRNAGRYLKGVYVYSLCPDRTAGEERGGLETVGGEKENLGCLHFPCLWKGGGGKCCWPAVKET